MISNETWYKYQKDNHCVDIVSPEVFVPAALKADYVYDTSCLPGILPSKAIGTGVNNKPLSEEHGLIKHFKSGIKIWDFMLVGGGDPGLKCGAQAITKIHPFGDSVGYEPLRCKRVECPDCAPYEIIKKVKQIAFKIESYARAHGQRPHAMVMSVHPEEEAKWDWDNFEISLFRRGYRRARELGVVGGVGIGHPFRLKRGVVDMLKADGVESHFWAAAKKDKLNLGSWREYVKFGYHEHSIGFPGYFEQHEDSEFFIKKYTVLEDLESVVRHLIYLLGHSGVLQTKTGSKDSVRWWGVLNGNSKDEEAYSEDTLSKNEQERIRAEIEVVLDSLEGVKLKEKRVVECPVTGMSVEHFFRIGMLPVMLNNHLWIEALYDTHGEEKAEALIGDLEALLELRCERGEIMLEACLKHEFKELRLFSLEVSGG